jgi:type II secretory pathway component PulC
MRLHRTAFAFALSSVISLASVALGACGGETPPARSPESESPQATAPTTTAAAVPEKITSLKRSQVKWQITKGLGYFLQNVTVEDYPAMRANKFYGWKVKSVAADWPVDIRPGDVVMRVNGMPIEHPEEADAALRSLEKAKALRVDFERDGKPQTLELPIVED